MATCAIRHFVPKVFAVDYLKCVLLNCLAQLGSESGHNEESDIPFSLKILIVMTRVHGGRAGCCLNWNIFEISVNCEF